MKAFWEAPQALATAEVKRLEVVALSDIFGEWQVKQSSSQAV